VGRRQARRAECCPEDLGLSHRERVLRYGARIEARRQRRSAPARTEIRPRGPEAGIAALRGARFSTAKRGYDREEVDRYVARVNQALAELQITVSPKAAIERALEDVERQKRSVVEEAHRTAEEITARSRSRADERIQEATQEGEKVREAAAQEAREIRDAAEHDARQIREAAEQRLRELEAEAEAMTEMRAQAIARLHELAGGIDDVVDQNGRERSPADVPDAAISNR
jgi:DivIVA domain-containing protein